MVVRAALGGTCLGATIVLAGMGSPELTLPTFLISTEERSAVGSFTYGAVDFRDAVAWAASSPELVDPLITRQVQLDEAPAAFAGLAAGCGAPGKVLVRLDL